MSYRRLRRRNAPPVKRFTPLTYGQIAAHGWPRGTSWTNCGSCISRASLCYFRKDFEGMSIHSIICGDSAHVLKTFEQDCIDLTVTSPPYDNLRTYNGFTFDFETIARELYRVTKPGGVLVWVVGDATVNGSETGTSFRQALYFMECGFRLHDTMIYQKNGNPFPPGNRYYQQFEFMFVFSVGTPKTINLLRCKTIYNQSRR